MWRLSPTTSMSRATSLLAGSKVSRSTAETATGARTRAGRRDRRRWRPRGLTPPPPGRRFTASTASLAQCHLRPSWASACLARARQLNAKSPPYPIDAINAVAHAASNISAGRPLPPAAARVERLTCPRSRSCRIAASISAGGLVARVHRTETLTFCRCGSLLAFNLGGSVPCGRTIAPTPPERRDGPRDTAARLRIGLH